MNSPFRMDEQSIFDILECSVCLERLDTTSRVLPCQHTFCMRCLQQILNTRGELRCPECRDLAPHQRVTDLPTNILLVRLLDGMKRPAPATPKITGSTSGSSGGSVGKSNGQADSTSASRSGVSKIPGPNQPCAKALYNYEGQESGDLSFNKGAIVLLLKRIDDNWYHGELDGSRGFFPASYVEVLTPLPPDPPQCKALYDFDVNEQEEKDCLTFNKDEVLMVIRRVDENWIEGQKGDKIGIFPISFVELNDTAKSLMDVNAGATAGDGAISGAGDGQGGSSSGHESSSSKNKSSNKRHSFTSMLGVQLRSKESKDSQERGSGSSGGGGGGGSAGGGGGGGGNGTSPSNRHSMEISSPVLLRSSNPTAATLIEAKAAAAAAMATGGPSPASSPSPSSSPLPVAAASGSSTQTATGGSRKKPAPLTLMNQPAAGILPPNSPTMLASGGPATPTLLPAQDPPSSPKPKVEAYVAMFNYKPLNPDEIELRKGEFYTVTEKCKDGWYKGLSVSSGQIGVFPGNYMQVYRHDRQEKQKKAASSSSTSSSTASSTTFASSSLSTSSSASTSRSAASSSQSSAPNSAAAGQNVSSGVGEKKSYLFDGQKTVAQMQSERAALRMQYQNVPQGAVSRPIQAPQTRLNERHPRGSPPTVGMETTRQGGVVASPAVAGSWPGNAPPVQTSVGNRSGQVHTAVQTSNANVAQTVRPRTVNPTAATTVYPNASQPGSPPVSHGTRTHGGVPLTTGLADSSNVQPGVPVRQACSQMVVPHQVARQFSHPNDLSCNLNVAPAKTKRVPISSSAQMGGPMLSSRHPVEKPRRFSESDHLSSGRATSSSSSSSSSSRQSAAAANHNNPAPISTTTTFTSPKSGLHAQPPPTSPLHAATFLFSKHVALLSGDGVGQAQVGADSGCRTPPPTLHNNSPPQVRGHRRRSGSMPSQFTLAHKADKKEKKKGKKPSNKHMTSNEAPELGGTRTTSPSRSAIRTTASATQSPNSSKSSSPETQQGEAPVAEAPAGAVIGGGEGARGGAGGERGETGAAAEQTPPKTTPLLRERYRVIVPYPPTTDAELELKIGDTVFVHKKREDGWFKGTLLRTGKTGLFPSSFAEPY